MKVLTFDIEEWWVYKNYSHYGYAQDYMPRINRYLNEILDLLDEWGSSATFFCLGDVAYNFPEVIKKIASKGHHIGCHSYSHRFLEDLNPKEFADDTKLAIDVIEDVIGEKVDAYRAPAFSITEKTSWALEILAENGVQYDCSIFPSYHRYGGYPSFVEEKPLWVQHNNATLKEFPVILTKAFGKRIAFSGGGYFRLLPYCLIKQITKKNEYVMAYFHIRDFDSALKNKISFRNVKMNPVNYFKNFYGIANCYSKFHRFFKEFNFLSVKQAAAQIDWKNVPVAKI